MESEKIRSATSLKCPACGGRICYAPDEGKLCCESCTSAFSVDEFVNLEKEWQPSAQQDWEELKGPEINKTDVSVYNCPGCGAGIMTDAVSGTVNCPYCGSDLVLDDKFEERGMPKGIIPFKQTREYARMTMRCLAAQKAGIPEKKIKESWLQGMQGVYMPYWIFDCGVTTVGVFSGKERKVTCGEPGVKIINETEYNITRIGTSRVDGILARASDIFKETSVRKLYPFNMGEMVDFNPALISGYKVILQELTPEKEKDIVQAEVDRHLLGNNLRNMVLKESRYDSVTPLFTFSKVKSASYSYCLLPMWISRFQYKGLEYIFAMNGQTGEAMIQQPPGVAEQWRVDNMGEVQVKPKIWLNRLIFAACLTAAAMVVKVVINPGFLGWVIALVVFVIAIAVFCVKEGRIQLEHMREGTSLYDDDPEGLFEGPSVSALGTPGSITVEVAHDEKRRTRKFKKDNLMVDQKLYQ
ncbi:MAG: hypothetical protein IKO53_03375 [Lachnospiraceae bacterium]|nr:hypothetical protein [Lachnospiraceae bacterium]